MNPKIHFSLVRISSPEFAGLAISERITEYPFSPRVELQIDALQTFGATRFYDRASFRSICEAIDSGIFGRGSRKRFIAICRFDDMIRFVAPVFIRSQVSDVLVPNYSLLSFAKSEASPSKYSAFMDRYTVREKTSWELLPYRFYDIGKFLNASK
jgi:hypothetical protein